MEFDHTELARTLREKYVEKYGHSPSQAANKVIDCIDDVFLDFWRKDVMRVDEEIQARADKAQQLANQTLGMLEKEMKDAEKSVKEAKKATEIKSKRVRDALQAYQTIVQMKFDTPQQELQNIQNASYFIWALYYKGYDMGEELFKENNGKRVSKINEEPTRSKDKNQWESVKGTY